MSESDHQLSSRIIPGYQATEKTVFVAYDPGNTTEESANMVSFVLDTRGRIVVVSVDTLKDLPIASRRDFFNKALGHLQARSDLEHHRFVVIADATIDQAVQSTLHLSLMRPQQPDQKTSFHVMCESNHAYGVFVKVGDPARYVEHAQKSVLENSIFVDKSIDVDTGQAFFSGATHSSPIWETFLLGYYYASRFLSPLDVKLGLRSSDTPLISEPGM